MDTSGNGDTAPHLPGEDDFALQRWEDEGGTGRDGSFLTANPQTDARADAFTSGTERGDAEGRRPGTPLPRSGNSRPLRATLSGPIDRPADEPHHPVNVLS